MKELLGEASLSTRRLSGGDISEVYWVKTEQREVVVKINRDPKGSGSRNAYT